MYILNKSTQSRLIESKLQAIRDVQREIDNQNAVVQTGVEKVFYI